MPSTPTDGPSLSGGPAAAPRASSPGQWRAVAVTGLGPDGRRRAVGTIVVSLLVLVAGAALVADGDPLPGEVAVVEAANAVPTVVGWPSRAVMQLGTLWAGLLVVAGVAWWTRRAGLLAPAAAFVAVALAFRLDNVLKDAIERPRPYDVLPGLEARDHVGGFAYPSGHTTMAVAIAGSLHPVLPARGRAVAWALAAVVAVARLHVGAHWPLDLMGGTALGLAIAAVAWLLVDRLPRCWFAPPASGIDGDPSPDGPRRQQ